MVFEKLREKLEPTVYYKPLIDLGKVSIALAAIGCFLSGLIDVDHFVDTWSIGFSISNVGESEKSLLWASLKIALGYGYYTLLDMRKIGLIVSIARFFAVLAAKIMMIYSLWAIIMGSLIVLFPDPSYIASISAGGIVFSIDSGAFLFLSSGISFCVGLGMIFFMHERDKFQNSKEMRKSENI